MVRLLAALLLLGALSAEAQIQTQPTGVKKMDGSDSGGGGGYGSGSGGGGQDPWGSGGGSGGGGNAGGWSNPGDDAPPF